MGGSAARRSSSLLEPLPALLHVGGAIGTQLLQTLLLLRCQHCVDIALHPRALHCQLGLGLNQLLRRGADRVFIDWQRFHRLVLGRVCLMKPVTERACLLPMLLHELAHLLPLRLGQVELAKRHAGAGAAWPAAPEPAPGTLRIRGAASKQHGREGRDGHDTKSTNHGSTSSLFIPFDAMWMARRWRNCETFVTTRTVTLGASGKWPTINPVERAPEPRRTVLVVEDEEHIRDLVCLHLQVEGFSCVPAGTGTEAVDLAGRQRFDLIVLDLMLPGVDGLSVCRAVRRSTINRDVPILMLTARREEADKVLGLDSGADDYLTKPFGIRELLARVRAVMRRRMAGGLPVNGDGQKPLTYRGIEMDPARRRVRVHGADVDLTAHEFNLLYVLLSQPGIVLTREALLNRVWRDDTFVTVRSVDTLIKRLRRKIEHDPSNPAVILTVWGAGYKAADV